VPLLFLVKLSVITSICLRINYQLLPLEFEVALIIYNSLSLASIGLSPCVVKSDLKEYYGRANLCERFLANS